ncbi:MAG: hypothetical protein KY397_00450 [Gemmatimonadetes bacterium]|nr:hypothetical protein [Gemmatimonadota bacterium]
MKRRDHALADVEGDPMSRAVDRWDGSLPALRRVVFFVRRASGSKIG